MGKVSKIRKCLGIARKSILRWFSSPVVDYLDIWTDSFYFTGMIRDKQFLAVLTYTLPL